MKGKYYRVLQPLQINKLEIDMPVISFLRKYKIPLVLLLFAFILCILFREFIVSSYYFLTDREQVKNFIASFGAGAPLVFISIQILQVLFAPFPGEASGFIGGYLFGTFPGFLLSSVGLTIGSCINFVIGRFLGKQYIRKLIPEVQLKKFDSLCKRQGVVFLFILFIFPGFPKDYLCLFLGLSSIPFSVFFIMASIGRMPGTLMLSIQGEFLFKQMYGPLAIVFAFSLVLVFFAYRYREDLYQWIEKVNKKDESHH